MRHPEKITKAVAKRAEWKRPQVDRMEAGMAEIGARVSTDGLNQS